MAVQVKICGVCSPADARAAGAAGASYIGVILAPGYPRTVTLEEADAILSAAAAYRVGVFVDAAPADVLHAADRLALDVVQLHGGEPPGTAAALMAAGSAQVWKAVRVRDARDVDDALAGYGSIVDGLLLDGWSPAGSGGVGAGFDWSAALAARASFPAGLQLIAAGGLRPATVAAAITLLKPDVVDVSSGVEASLRCKSPELVREFIAAAHAAGGST
jgi:phosphoribosylanthranilate isomerase